jgi:hypothetical protein
MGDGQRAARVNPTRRTQLTGVLVALQHEMRLSSRYIPELDASVLGTGDHPLTIGRNRDGKNVVL